MFHRKALMFTVLVAAVTGCSSEEEAPAADALPATPTVVIGATTCEIAFGHATLDASVEVTMEVGQELMTEFDAGSFESNYFSPAYDCGAWTTLRYSQDTTKTTGCRRDAGQAATQTIRVVDQKLFAQQPGPTSEAATLTAVVEKLTVDGAGVEHRDELARSQANVTCN